MSPGSGGDLLKSLRGDFLYDIAWCSVWGLMFYPEVATATADPLSGLLQNPGSRADQGSLVDPAVRHHCYERQIGFTHLGWSMRTWNQEHLTATATATAELLAEILERGPRPSTSI